jgi:1-acyl-sn-glycerol-3-phosphate acyltransferase
MHKLSCGRSRHGAFWLDFHQPSRQFAGAMLEPTAEQLATLSRFERASFRLCDVVNRRPIVKRVAHAYLRTIGASWVHLCTRNVLHAWGQEQLQTLQPDRGVLIVCNHRTFFDMYVLSSVLLREAPWVRGMYFPVRSNYFYERVDGVVVNALMSALAMYPPILRDPAKRAMNRYSVELLVELARQPGRVLGVHPEGTRNRGDDPYSLLPAQPGVGEIVHAARPIVIPAFILGMNDELASQVKGNFKRTGPPITLLFGNPIDTESYAKDPPRLRTYKRIADDLVQKITELGQQEKQIRQREGFPSLECSSPNPSPRPKRQRAGASRSQH